MTAAQASTGGGSGSGSGGYQAPAGGGGTTNTIQTPNGTVTFGHGGRHIPGADVSTVEQAIANNVPRLGAGEYLRDIPINVNGTNYLYNAYGLEGGVVNVGTYHLVP